MLLTKLNIQNETGTGKKGISAYSPWYNNSNTLKIHFAVEAFVHHCEIYIWFHQQNLHLDSTQCICL